MIKEVVQFLRNGPEITRLQRQHTRAEFVDRQNALVDAQGFSEVRRELVGDLSGRVLEIGCGTGTMFEYYKDGVELDAIEPEEDFLALAVPKAETAAARIHAVAGDGSNHAMPKRVSADRLHPRRPCSSFRSSCGTRAILLLGFATLAACGPATPPTCDDCRRAYETGKTICQTASTDPTGGGREACMEAAEQSYRDCQVNCTPSPVH